MKNWLSVIHSFLILFWIILCTETSINFVTMLSIENDYNILKIKKNNQLAIKKLSSLKQTVIYVATFDGTFMAISYKTGDIIWKLNNKFKMYTKAEYFNSNFNDNNHNHFSKFENTDENNVTQSFRTNYNINNEYIVPSIDGRIYHFKNSQYRVITDSFKDFIGDSNSSSSNSNYVRSSVEILLLGVEPWNGNIFYECNGIDCNYPPNKETKIMDHLSHHIDSENVDLSKYNILVIEYQMFRRFNTNLNTGEINWNVTHNTYTLRYIEHDNLFQDEDTHEDVVCNANNNSLSNSLRYDALNDILENYDDNWSIRLKAPIISLWSLSKNNGLHKIGIQSIIYIPRIKNVVNQILKNGQLCEDSLLLFLFDGQPYFVPIVNFGAADNSNGTVFTRNCCCATIYTISELISDNIPDSSFNLITTNDTHPIGLFGNSGPIRNVPSSSSYSKTNYHINDDQYYYKLQSYGSFEPYDANYKLQLLAEPYNIEEDLSSNLFYATIAYWTNKILHILKLFGIVGSLVTVFYNTIYFCIRRTFEHFRRLPESSPLTLRKSLSLVDTFKFNNNDDGIVNQSVPNNTFIRDELCATNPPVTVSRYMSDFNHIKKLGKGGFGHVYMAKNVIDECEYAIKRIRLPDCTTARVRVMREVQALAKLNHPGVVRFYNAWFEPTVTSQDPTTKATKTIPLCPALHDDSELSVCSVDSYEDKGSNSKGNPANNCLQIDFNNPFVIPQDALPLISSTSNDMSNETHCLSHDESELTSLERRSLICTHNIHSDLYIQMQLCKSETLHEWLIENITDRNISLCIHYFKQILEAISYIHSQNFIHRDLKPSNIFFSMDDVIKIGDFGLVTHTLRSTILQDSHGKNIKIKNNPRISVSCSNNDINLHYYTKLVGTELYMAPEQVNCAKYDYTIDIYALALILTELVLPFKTQTERYITLGKIKLSKQNDELREKYSSIAQLIEWMLADDPKNRPTAKDILDSDLIQSLWSKYNVNHFK